MTKPLADTNPFLKDPKRRAEILLRQTVDSSAFEGARGLGHRDSPSASAKAAARASAKNPAKGE